MPCNSSFCTYHLIWPRGWYTCVAARHDRIMYLAPWRAQTLHTIPHEEWMEILMVNLDSSNIDSCVRRTSLNLFDITHEPLTTYWIAFARPCQFILYDLVRTRDEEHPKSL